MLLWRPFLFIELLFYLLSFFHAFNFQVHLLKHLSGGGVEFDSFRVQSRNFWNVVITTFAFFSLEFDGDSADRALLDSLHSISNETSNLVLQSLSWNNSDLLNNTRIGVVVESELGIIFLYNTARSLLDGLGTYAAHC